MIRMKIDVWCCKCWSGHQAEIEVSQLLPGENTLDTECPSCGEPLLVAYELRAHVISVKPAEHEYPRTWPVEARPY